MVLFFADKKWLRMKGKGHLVEYYMACYTVSHHRGQTSKSLFLFIIAGISFTS